MRWVSYSLPDESIVLRYAVDHVFQPWLPADSDAPEEGGLEITEVELDEIQFLQHGTVVCRIDADMPEWSAWKSWADQHQPDDDVIQRLLEEHLRHCEDLADSIANGHGFAGPPLSERRSL